MQFRMVVVSLAVALAAVSGWADIGPSEADLQGVVKSLKGLSPDKPAQYRQTSDRFLTFIGAPPDTAFVPSASPKSATPESVARAYLAEHGKAFGISSNRTAFARERIRSRGSDAYVRLEQNYGGIPVFGAQVNVQVNDRGGIQSIFSDILRDTAALDDGRLSLVPTLTRAQAESRAINRVRSLHPEADDLAASAPALLIYDPGILDLAGPTRLVWDLVVESPSRLTVKRRVLVDAHTGDIALDYSLVHDGLFRRIFDHDGAFDDIGILRRQEGQPATGIPDVDLAYDYLGDTYNFYFDHHGRDSLDGAGVHLNALVHYQEFGLDYDNAAWDGQRMIFGRGWVTDDITAHELTHGVTDWASGLIYYGESGAINEAFSDIWGEFIDLTNQKGNDAPEVRWEVGEELSFGAIRNMKDPGKYTFFDPIYRVFAPYPDRYSTFYYFAFFDNGGVHINSSIINKLAYLLTDGDTHNGYDVAPLNPDPAQSIATVAGLFYEVQTNLLTAGAGFNDLAVLLIHAAYNLDFTLDQIRSIEFATKAVEIMPADPPRPVRHLRAMTQAGQSDVVLRWEPAVWPDGTIPPATVVRRQDRFPEHSSDGSVLATNEVDGTYTDNTAAPNTEYYYAVFSPVYDPGSKANGEAGDFARAIAGAPEPDYLTESFSANGGRPFDLSYTQFTFDPLMDFTAANASGLLPEQRQGYATYANYTVVVEKNVFTLPVNSQNALYLPLLEDGWMIFTPPAPIPFFGDWMTTGILGTNGYITRLEDGLEISETASTDAYNFPSVKSHFDWRKISFLFSDLSPDSGGVVWYKELPDRIVFTFERVPEFGSGQGNTVQVELYYSGRIRITLLEIHAQNVVVGLSDGNGIPMNLATGKVAASNLDALPTARTALAQNPAGPIMANEQEEIRFTVSADLPGGTPVFEAGRVDPLGLLSPLPDGAAFTPGNGSSTNTAEFVWTPAFDQSGFYVLRTVFKESAQAVSQDIQVIVGNINQPPGLANAPRIVPAEPQDSQPLRVVYEYTHPENIPEGPTAIYWYKNGVYIAGLVNQREVPASVTKVGDVWHALVIPYTNTLIEGGKFFTEPVTVGIDQNDDVNKDGRVDAVDLQIVINAVLGKSARVLSADVDYDHEVNARDVQLLVNSILNRFKR